MVALSDTQRAALVNALQASDFDFVKPAQVVTLLHEKGRLNRVVSKDNIDEAILEAELRDFAIDSPEHLVDPSTEIRGPTERSGGNVGSEKKRRRYGGPTPDASRLRVKYPALRQ